MNVYLPISRMHDHNNPDRQNALIIEFTKIWSQIYADDMDELDESVAPADKKADDVSTVKNFYFSNHKYCRVEFELNYFWLIFT